MKILIYLGHPAQYHFYKNICAKLVADGATILFLIKKKDVLEQLLTDDGAEFINILPEGREATKSGLLIGLAKRDYRLLRIVRQQKPSLLLGSDPSISHVGTLTGLPSLTILEDDFNVIPYLSALAYPFTNKIIAPYSCNCGPWDYKKISYAGYMKLAYLHPNYFQPKDFIGEKYFLIRCSGLDAHHDMRSDGLDRSTLMELIEYLECRGQVKMLSEKPLESYFEPYQLSIKPAEIHQHLYHAEFIVSDSQSMTMEAAMLGVPSIRYSSFVGRIGVLEELEHVYLLTQGIKPSKSELLFSTIDELLKDIDLRNKYQRRRQKMLSEKIDVTQFFAWLIAEYPASIERMICSPDHQFQFI